MLCFVCRRQELSYECKATLFDQEVRMAENIDFQFPMKKACSQDIQVSPSICIRAGVRQVLSVL